MPDELHIEHQSSLESTVTNYLDELEKAGKIRQNSSRGRAWYELNG